MAEAAQTLIWPTMHRSLDSMSFAMETGDLRLFLHTLQTNKLGVMQAEIMVAGPDEEVVQPFIRVDPGEALVAMV